MYCKKTLTAVDIKKVFINFVFRTRKNILGRIGSIGILINLQPKLGNASLVDGGPQSLTA